MPGPAGIDLRTLRVVWTVFLFLLALWLVYEIGHTIVIFALALFLAHLLAPAVNWTEIKLARALPKHARIAALAVVYVVCAGLAIAILVPVGSQVGQQAAALAGKLPEAMQNDPIARLPLPYWLEDVRPRLTEILRAQAANLDETVLPRLGSVGTGILSGLGNILAVVLIPILTVFFLLDGASLRQNLVELAPPSRRPLVAGTLSDLNELLAQYIKALVILAIVVFIAYSIALIAMGVPYAVLLASVAAVLEVIPVVGPLIGSAIILIVVGLTGSTGLLGVLVFLVVFRVFQDYVVNPKLMGSGVELHPLLVLFGVLAGEQVAGIPGMFFSVPVIAALRIVVSRLAGRSRKMNHATPPDTTRDPTQEPTDAD